MILMEGLGVVTLEVALEWVGAWHGGGVGRRVLSPEPWATTAAGR